MSIQFKFVYMYSRNAIDIMKCANKRAVHILGGAYAHVHLMMHLKCFKYTVSALQGVGLEGLKGFHYIQYIHIRVHIMYAN